MDSLIEYLNRESNHKHTEFRLVVTDGGHSYIHVYGRASETFDFNLPVVINEIPEDIKDQINKDIDSFKKN